MLFSDIKPFIRYARYMTVDRRSSVFESVAYDVRLFYTVEGRGSIIANGTTYHMDPGSLLIVNSGIPYFISSECDYVRYIVLNFDYTQSAQDVSTPVPPAGVDNFDTSLLLDKCDFSDARQLDTAVYLTDAKHLGKRFDMIVREYTLKLIHYRLKTSSILTQCLAECMRDSHAGTVVREKGVVDSIIEYIHKNSSSPLTNIAIGEKFGYHPNYISSVIKLSTGMPLHQYLIRVRLMKAVEMLENSNHTISEIAELCGFCDIAYFSAYFKKHFGTSPANYRGI